MRPCALVPVFALAGCLGYSSEPALPGEGPDERRVLFDLRPTQPELEIPSGRIAVVWYQFDDDYEVEPELAYDASFDSGAGRVSIALADVKTPRPDLLYDHSRGRTDEVRVPLVGTGVVIVTQDTNANGRTDPGEFGYWGWGGAAHGLAYMHFGWADEEHDPSPEELRWLFTDAVRRGVWPYGVIPRPPDPRWPDAHRGMDALESGTLEESYELQLCEPDHESCELVEFPNLT